MLANTGNRFKTGTPGRNGANPYWRGLVGLLTFGNAVAGSGASWASVAQPNPAGTKRDAAFGWANTNIVSRNGQGNFLQKIDQAGPYYNNLVRAKCGSGVADVGVCVFMDWVYRGTNMSVSQMAWQTGGWEFSSAGSAVRMLVARSGLDSWASASVSTIGTTSGDRNRAYGWAKGNQARAFANGTSAAHTTGPSSAINRDDTIYMHASDWDGDVDINMIAIWVGPPLPEPAARRLTVHPNPIELFR